METIDAGVDKEKPLARKGCGSLKLFLHFHDPT